MTFLITGALLMYHIVIVLQRNEVNENRMALPIFLLSQKEILF